MSADPFIAEIFMFGGNFAPRNFALCDGQLLPIIQNQALFALVGTTYGGDGRTTFGLPDLRGRVPIHAGSGPGLTPRNLGLKSGQENVTLTANQMPSHTHAIQAFTGEGDSNIPTNAALAKSGTGGYHTGAPDTNMSANSIQATGGNQSHTNIQPYLAVNFIVALVGLFPSRN